jgi:outer membrane receptor protein involved in Fe transport
LEGVSKSAFSAAILFENKNWNMQVAADHSGRQVVLNDSVGGLSEYAAPITWVTASIAYNVTENISVSLEGKNLTDAYSLSTLGRPDILAGFETWGRTYILGVSAKF